MFSAAPSTRSPLLDANCEVDCRTETSSGDHQHQTDDTELEQEELARQRARHQPTPPGHRWPPRRIGCCLRDGRHNDHNAHYAPQA